MLVVVQVILAIGKLYIIRYVSLTITCAYMLCAWVMSSDFDDSEGCSKCIFHFRFYRSSMNQHEYNLKGNLIQENI